MKPFFNCNAALLFVMILFSSSIAAQQKVLVKGLVIDSATQQPLQSASITVDRSAYGTITNGNGEFSLYLPLDAVIDVSYIGYNLLHIRIATITNRENLRITLHKSNADLTAITLRVRDPLRIINRAIEKIPVNYMDHPHISKGFYRTTMLKQKEHIELSEAVFDIFNYGYTHEEKSQLRLQRMRAVKDEVLTKDLRIGLNPNDVFDCDFVKNIADDPIFGKKRLKKYDFVIEGVVDYQGMRAWYISFDQKPAVKEALHKGYVYIDSASSAFIAAEYGLSPIGMRYFKYGSGSQRLLMKVMDIHIDLEKDKRNISYRKVNDRWVLSSVMSSHLLSFKSGRRNYDYHADLGFQYLVTDVDTTAAVPFNKDEVLGNNKVIEMQNADMSPGFWKDYTILLPEFDVEAVAASIKRKNEQSNLLSKAGFMLDKMGKKPVAIKLDSLLSFYNRQHSFNGSALIRYKGEMVLNKSYGFANIDEKKSADENTVYRVGSLSKSFTALLINQLANEGKLQLQSPIKNYLPWYRHGDLTIQQLLTHQSGIPNFTTNDNYLAEVMSGKFSLKDMVIKFCSDSLEFASGTAFNYSNSGYVVLALIAQELGAKAFDQLLKEKIFDPAGMTNTYSGTFPATVDNQAVGYFYGKPEPSHDPANVTGSGGISSTTADLLKYAQALKQYRLLPKDKMEELYTPRVEYKDWNANYGYGWMIDINLFNASKKHRIIYHPGTDFGFYSMFVMTEDIEIILLNNTGDFPRFDLVEMMMNELE